MDPNKTINRYRVHVDGGEFWVDEEFDGASDEKVYEIGTGAIVNDDREGDVLDEFEEVREDKAKGPDFVIDVYDIEYEGVEYEVFYSYEEGMGLDDYGARRKDGEFVDAGKEGDVLEYFESNREG